jgi:hypothetical protein
VDLITTKQNKLPSFIDRWCTILSWKGTWKLDAPFYVPYGMTTLFKAWMLNYENPICDYVCSVSSFACMHVFKWFWMLSSSRFKWNILPNLWRALRHVMPMEGGRNRWNTHIPLAPHQAFRNRETCNLLVSKSPNYQSRKNQFP